MALWSYLTLWGLLGEKLAHWVRCRSVELLSDVMGLVGRYGTVGEIRLC